MLTFKRQDELEKININDVDANSLYKIFCKAPSLSVAYVVGGKKLAGVINRDYFIRVADAESDVKKYFCLDFARIILDDDISNGIVFNKIKKQATDMLLADSKITYIVVMSSSGDFIGAFERVVISKEIGNYNIIMQWLELAQQGKFYIGGYFARRGVKTIAVYGSDKDSALFINEIMHTTDVKIKYIISDKKSIINGISTSLLNEFETIDDVDAVVFIDGSKKDEGMSRIRPKTNAILVSLMSIMTDIYNYEYFAANLLHTLGKLVNDGFECLMVHCVTTTRIKNPSILEKKMDIEVINSGKLRENPEKYYNDLCISKHYSLGDFIKRSRIPYKILPRKGYWVLSDYNNELINAVNSRRIVPDAPSEYSKTLHIFGDSVAYGALCSDSETFANQLQKILNQNSLPVKVVNYGVPALQRDAISNYIQDTDFQVGDIIVCETSMLPPAAYASCKEMGIPMIDCAELFARPHDMGEVFIDRGHPNYRGHIKIAEAIYDEIFVKKLHDRPRHVDFKHYFDINSTTKNKSRIKEISYHVQDSHLNNIDLQKYISNLEKEKSSIKGTIGAIVMNCNPFTLGHRYVVEKSASQVDFLYIFVVEEDKSVFPFEDRLALVKSGVSDIKNVKVLSSGKFIISNATFPEYFTKSEKNEATIDVSVDLEIFAKKIAPTLEITKRFVGDEPACNITRQYNEAMKKLFPKFGISLIEFERIKDTEGEFISASRVRKLLENKDFNGIRKIVPKTTLEYLVRHFHQNCKET
ncbi:MAG: adenylyltransferase/cytidyltransferase family protein [Campylobacteraceae bacterium]|nr:adenylyltransferase/cytidyltransferase family protein [Campylobacteraceae bacterium]